MNLNRLQLIEVLRRVKSDIAVERITDAATWADLHLDSLDLVAALVELENEFDLPSNSIDFAKITTFGELIQTLATANNGEQSKVDSAPNQNIQSNGIGEFVEHLRQGTALTFLAKQTFADVRDKAALYRAVRGWSAANGTNLYNVSLKGGSRPHTDVFAGETENKNALVFSVNHYLALHRHPEVIAAARRATDTHGTGCGTSSASGGYSELHKSLELNLSEFVEQEAGIIFPTGYTANLGAICALVGRGDRVVVDREIHASIYDGCRLSGAKIEPFVHNDVRDLDRALSRKHAGTTLVIVESVYSMGGADADLRALIETAHRHNALIMVDESHAFGFYGARGAGLAEAQNVLADVDVFMTTMSKSLASVGGFIAGRRDLVELIRGTSRALNFQACAPASSIAAAGVALDLIKDGYGREKLWANTNYFRQGLTDLDLPTAGTSPVVPVFADSALAARMAAQMLFEKGIYTPPITYPAVPMDASRLRFTITAAHSTADLDRALSALNSIGKDAAKAVNETETQSFRTNNGQKSLDENEARLIELIVSGEFVFDGGIADLGRKIKEKSLSLRVCTGRKQQEL